MTISFMISPKYLEYSTDIVNSGYFLAHLKYRSNLRLLEPLIVLINYILGYKSKKKIVLYYNVSIKGTGRSFKYYNDNIIFACIMVVIFM